MHESLNQTEVKVYCSNTLSSQINFSFHMLELILGPEVPLDTNPAYIDISTSAKHIAGHMRSDIAVRKNKAYNDVILDSTSRHTDTMTSAKHITGHSDIALRKNKAYMEVILDSTSRHTECI